MKEVFTRLWQEMIEQLAARGAGEAEELPEGAVPPPPVIWLLGKTGAGKSSLIRALTGLESVEIGNGFQPCTKASRVLPFPADRPLMRFLDTRGLGEVDYDPAEDLAEAEKAAHLVLVVARLDDPVQGEVEAALRKLCRRRPELRVMLVITGADLAADAGERARAEAGLLKAFSAAARTDMPHVTLSLAEGQEPPELAQVVDFLAGTIPHVALSLGRGRHRPGEPGRWAEHRAEVLWYAGAASTADAVPLVGAVAVPGIQAAMLNALARRYGVSWSRARFQEFAAALGTAIALRYGASYGIRQLAKLVPVVGQTAGAALASTLSFATTFALGRAAARYLDGLARGEEASPEELRGLYLEAFRKGRGGEDGK